MARMPIPWACQYRIVVHASTLSNLLILLVGHPHEELGCQVPRVPLTDESGSLFAWNQHQAAVASNMKRFGQHEVASLGRPAWRVVGELQKRPASHAGGHVQVCQHTDAVGPGVRREPAVASQRQL